METIKLTQYSKGSGCGCKIAPDVLQKVLSGHKQNLKLYPEYVAGIGNNEDAAVYDLGSGQYLISTNDFFTPIVDDPFDFGRIAAANAISDVYAMGGKPILAIAILGWPVDKIDITYAQKIVEGARNSCEHAGILLGGGHSINSPEPFFGLSVNGIVAAPHLKKNNTAREGDLIFLTKKIGVGILSNALKKNKLNSEYYTALIEQMAALNSIGEKFGALSYVSAMTDITGFGLLGHLHEMAGGAGLTAEISYDKIPLMTRIDDFISQMCIPDNTYRNWNNYEKGTEGISANSLFTLCDPQTNGGLLVTVNSGHKEEFQNTLIRNGFDNFVTPIGRMVKKNNETLVKIIDESKS